jgi:hypothetical protein
MFTVSWRFAPCENAPLVPWAVIVNVPVAAFAAAPNTTDVLEPADTLNGLEGFEVTPPGSPPSVTCTVPLNPFRGLTDTLTGELVVPWVTLIVLAEMTMEKSGCGGDGAGGGGC